MKPLPVQDLVSTMLSDDAQFLVPEGDRYWTPSVLAGLYEPEIHWVLHRAADRPFFVFDAGANFGYWSILATSALFGRHPAIAIEPALANFSILVKNSHANGERFEVLRRAVSDETWHTLTLYGRKHEGMSLRKDWHPNDVDRSEQVESIRLDAVVTSHAPKQPHPAFIKLDIEGAEIAGIRGASRLIGEGALVVYEDHGKEPTHPVSRFVLSLEGHVTWRIGADMRPVRVTTVEEVATIKTDSGAGYNFFTCRESSPWSSL